MNKRFTLASLAIVLGICAFIFFTQTQVLTVSRPAVHAQSAYGVRAVKNVRVQNYNALGENISYYDKVPQRVIAVGEQINETLVALGVEQNVICPCVMVIPSIRLNHSMQQDITKSSFSATLS